MVKKIVVKILCVCAICIACVGTHTIAHAYDYSVYDGNLSNTYVTYFRDILSGCNMFDDYLVFRSGQYQYVMVVGEIEQNEKVFSWENATEYVITTGTNSAHTYTVYTDVSATVDVSDNIVYSNLGNYPLLEERSVIYEKLTLFTLVVIALCVLISRIFKFNLRNCR